jgi:hypothetical protein
VERIISELRAINRKLKSQGEDLKFFRKILNDIIFVLVLLAVLHIGKDLWSWLTG